MRSSAATTSSGRRRFGSSGQGGRRRKSALLVSRLYPYIFGDPRLRFTLPGFFGRGLDQADDLFFSHRIRWKNTGGIRNFFSPDLRAAVGSYSVSD
ncbi:MAG: hypothetical protein MZV70_05530 [Desulfobacterales bacterium]|nr:hypothetical protein [Desulfobacterales bacterium]